MAKITHIVLHYSATYEDQNLTVRDIDRMHRDRGWKMVGYHYVIRRDGTVEQGRPETMVGAHVAGQNTGKIGVCCIGGLNRATGPNVGVDNRTAAQIDATIKLVRDLLKRHPGAKVVGHRDLGATQCPGFDVPTWWAKVQKTAAPKKPAVVLPDDPTVTPAVGEESSHVVQKGETWWSIAQMHGLGVADLARANGSAPTDTLAAGRKLTLVVPRERVEVPVEVEVPVVPPAVEREVEKTERNAWWQWLTVVPLASIGAFFQDYPQIAYPALAGVAVVAVVAVIGGRRLVRRVKGIVAEARA